MNDVAKEMKHLQKLARRAPGKRFTRLWANLITELWLAHAWEEIRRHQGSQTPGVDRQTAKDIDLDRLRQLSKRLRTGQYTPTPVRRVYIPKGNGKLRPLGIPTSEDRIVQQAIRMLLEPIFEADFFPCSHGFRQGRSTHTALKHVAQRYNRTTWIIEGDLVGCFDNIPHTGLMEAIKRRIADRRMLSLIKRFLKAGYLENWQYHQTYSGTPQGGILSPLLCNIFLHQLDEYMINELQANKPETKRETLERRNPKYHRIDMRIQKRRKYLKGETCRARRRALVDQLRELEKIKAQTRYYTDKHRTVLGYARYADDFVILVNGNRNMAHATTDKVRTFLASMGLALSEEKTKLTHWSKPIHFLGYHIRGRLRGRGDQIQPILSIPRDQERSIKQEIQSIARYHHIPDIDAFTQIGAMYRGWCNYYRYAKAPQKSFSRIARKAWWYTAHFRARKERTSIKKMLRKFQKAGRYKVIRRHERHKRTFTARVGKREVYLDIFPPKTETIYNVSVGNWRVDLKPVNPRNWQQGRSRATRLTALTRSGGRCEHCGANPATHTHHKAKMKTKRTPWAKIQSDQDQRSTAIALCEACHLAFHQGTWK